jgi:hypothetical protein
VLGNVRGSDEVAKADAKSDAKEEAKAAANEEAKEEAKAEGDTKPDEAKAEDADEGEDAGDDEEDGRLGDAVSDAASTLVGSIPAKPEAECIHGTWNAVDYSAAVRQAIRKDPQLRSFTKKSADGHITYELRPPEDGKGTIVADADHLRYSFAGKVQGIAVNVKIDIDGSKTGEYALPEPGRLVVSKPSEEDMRIKVNAKIKGFGNYGDRTKLSIGFKGDYDYACDADKLEVWDHGGSKADALTFERAKEE